MDLEDAKDIADEVMLLLPLKLWAERHGTHAAKFLRNEIAEIIAAGVPPLAAGEEKDDAEGVEKLPDYDDGSIKPDWDLGFKRAD